MVPGKREGNGNKKEEIPLSEPKVEVHFKPHQNKGWRLRYGQAKSHHQKKVILF